MLKWLRNDNNIRNTKIIGLNTAICSTYQDILNKNFKYVNDYKNHVKQFQSKYTTVYIRPEDYDKENLCHICLSPLLGPCSMFVCDCCLTIHEGCMLRYMLAGYKQCPICDNKHNKIDLDIHAEYPTTLSITKIRENFNKLLHNDNLNIESLLHDIKKNTITDTNALHKMYT